MSPDGKTLAVRIPSLPDSKWSSAVELLQVETQQKCGVIPRFGPSWGLQFSADSKRIAVHPFGYGGVKQVAVDFSVWHITGANPSLLTELILPPSDGFSVSPDFRLAVFNEGAARAATGTTSIWDFAKKTRTFASDYGERPSLHWSNGNYLVLPVCCSKEDWYDSEIWNVSDEPRRVGTVASHGNPTVSEEWLAAGDIGGVRIHDLATGVEKVRLIHSGDIAGVDTRRGESRPPKCEVSNNKRRALISQIQVQHDPPFFAKWLPHWINPFREGTEDVCRLWDVASGRELLDMPGCPHAVLSRDGGTLGTMDVTGNISIWDLPLRKPLWKIAAISAALSLCPFALGRCIRRIRIRRDPDAGGKPGAT